MITIIAALKDEISFILKEMDVRATIHLRPAIIIHGEYLGKELLLAHTGIGTQKMKRATEFCIKEFKTEACINIGYCGALAPELSLGDVVIADSVAHETENRTFHAYKNSEKLSDAVKGALKSSEVKFLNGTMLTVDKVIDAPHEKAYLGTKFGAIAVDMESFGLAEVADALNTPFAVIRSVMDPMDMPLPKLAGVVGEDGSTKMLNVATNLIRHPQNIASMPHLQFCASKARESLARFTNELIKIY